MEILIVWVLLSVAVGVWAGNRGRSGFGWFVLAVLVSPLIAGVFLAVTQNHATTREAVNPETHGQCPACSEPVILTATVCKHCKSDIAERGGVRPIERKKTVKDSDTYKTVFWILFIIVVIALFAGGRA